MEYHTKPPKKHLGHKIGRMREILGIKQEVLADKLGVSQQKISSIEQSEEIEEKLLNEIADALGVKPEAIRNFSEEAIFNQISNTLNDNSALYQNYQCTINPIERWLEAIEQNKKLYEELLKSERKKVAMLEKLLDKK